MLSAQEDWVDAFHDQLESEVNERIGRVDAIKIWRDDGTWVSDNDIERAIKRSAIFRWRSDVGKLIKVLEKYL